MKVFNWVHRRFLHVQSGVTSLQDDKGVERSGKLKVDAETHALLEHDGHLVMDMINDWKEGILAIGTLAIGPLEPNCELLNDEDGNNNGDDHDYVYQDDYDDDDYDDDEDGIESSPLMKMTLFSHELEKMDIDDDMDGLNACKEIKQFDDEKECQVKRRVTLADLFLEESVKETKKGSSNYVSDHTHYFSAGKSSLKIKPTSTSPAKNGLSKAKKLLKEELRPIKKLNQLMKRMMKKKVHPDMVETAAGGRTQKDIGMQPMKATSELHGPYESASLLLLQDSEV